MEKETLIKKMLNEKAEKNNTIDLNAYAIGLDEMYEAQKTNNKHSSSSLPIEEVALHAADEWFDTASRSDLTADLKSYYEGYRDALRFRQGN